MPDRQIMEQIKEREQRRAQAVHDMLFINQAPTDALDHVDLAVALGTLADDWRATAELYDKAKLKGAQSAHIVPLRHAAAELDKVTKGLKAFTPSAATSAGTVIQVTDGVATTVQPNHVMPPSQPCPAADLKQGHGAHSWVCGPATAEAWCTGHVETTPPSGLDALIADSVAKGHGAVKPPTEVQSMHAFEVAEGASGAGCTAMVVRDGAGDQCGERYSHPIHIPVEPEPWEVSPDEVRDFLSGVSNDLPAAEPRGVTDRPAEAPAQDTEPTPAQTVMAAREIGATMQVPVLGQAGNNPGDYDPTYVPPGGRVYTYADLLTPVNGAFLPPHLSNSQINTVGDCGLKYRLQRVEQVPQIPQWANIGGSAFHAAVEDMERHEITEPGTVIDRVDPERAWRHHFTIAIEATAAASPVPEARWRAAKSGVENRTWWEVNGPLMLQRYIDARSGDRTIIVDSAGTPGLEWPVVCEVPTPYGPLPFRAVLDRVTSADGVIVIRDYKTSFERPSDTTQLGDYAHALMLSGAVPIGTLKIVGSFFDARRGEWTKPVDLLAAHPFEAFQYRVTAAHAQRRALTTGPTPARPSFWCGGCSVRYACPVKSLAPRS